MPLALPREICDSEHLCNAAGGSGSAYIYGFCDRNWRPDFTEQVMYGTSGMCTSL